MLVIGNAIPIKRQHRLASITLSTDGEAVRQYVLSYVLGKTSKRSLLTSVKTCSAGTNPVCLPGINILRQDGGGFAPSKTSSIAAPAQAAEGNPSAGEANDNARDVGDEGESAGPVNAQLSFDAPKLELKAGDSEQISLKLKTDGGLRSLPLQIGFDSKLFDVSAVTEGGFFKKSESTGIFSSTISQSEGEIFVSAASSNIRGLADKIPCSASP